MDWKRIIVALDDSPRAFNAVEYVGSLLGNREDVVLCLLHIYSEPPPYYYRSGGTADAYKKEQEALAQKLFERAAAILVGHGVSSANLTSRCLMADHTSISAAILDMQVREHYGTIVVGKRGIPKAEEFLFGSISNALVHTGKDIAVWVIG